MRWILTELKSLKLPLNWFGHTFELKNSGKWGTMWFPILSNVSIKAKAQYQIPLNQDPPHLPRFHISLVATSCKCPRWTLFWKYREMRILPTLKWALQQVGNVADISWYFYDIWWDFDEILWYFLRFYDILMWLLTLKRALHQVAIQPAPRPRDAGTKIVKLGYFC